MAAKNNPWSKIAIRVKMSAMGIFYMAKDCLRHIPSSDQMPERECTYVRDGL
jgi:hypothetical protein